MIVLPLVRLACLAILLAGVGTVSIIMDRRLQPRKQRAADAASDLDHSTTDTVAEKPVVEEKPATELLPSRPDDFTRVEGIGPKISKLLLDQDIATFTQLAETGVDRLRQILQQANLRMTDPSTWPEQAKLAAAGQLKALEALQKKLTAGRRE